MINRHLEHRILEELDNHQRPIVVAICGAADLGKSYLSEQLIKSLKRKNILCGHLTLDSFLMDRAKRNQNGWSGYQKEAHNIIAIESTLKTWKATGELSYRPYCHITGKKETESKQIQASSVLIIEGLFALDDLLLPHIDSSIFVYTTDETLKGIKLEADLEKRGYSKIYSESIYQKEFQLYKSNIEPFKQIADYKLFLSNKWNYTLEEK